MLDLPSLAVTERVALVRALERECSTGNVPTEIRYITNMCALTWDVYQKPKTRSNIPRGLSLARGEDTPDLRGDLTSQFFAGTSNIGMGGGMLSSTPSPPIFFLTPLLRVVPFCAEGGSGTSSRPASFSLAPLLRLAVSWAASFGDGVDRSGASKRAASSSREKLAILLLEAKESGSRQNQGLAAIREFVRSFLFVEAASAQV